MKDNVVPLAFQCELPGPSLCMGRESDFYRGGDLK